METTKKDQIAAVAAGQRGLITLDQLRDLQVTAAEIETMKRTRWVLPARRGVLRLAGARYDDEAIVMAALLACGGGAVASHDTAGWLWGLPGVGRSDRLHVTVDVNANPRPAGITMHRTQFFDERHRTVHRGVPIVTPARALVDLSGRLGPKEIGAAADFVVREGLAKWDEVRTLAEELLPQGGRRRAAALLKALESRRGERLPSGSDLERRVATVLGAAGVPLPVPQFEVTVGSRRFRLDFAYPDIRLGIEFLGYQWHGDRTRFDHDAERTSLLTAAGWSLLTFTSRSDDRHIVRSTRNALIARGVPAA